MLSIFHPEYDVLRWDKWRLTYEGGDDFINRYLVKFSAREDDDDFLGRKAIAYCPAHAKAAVNDIKNAIFQRINDVTREGGPNSYRKAMNGELSGVDLRGGTMNDFVGRQVLPEMLVMSKVGVYVDREPLPEALTVADTVPHPYLYIYKAEDILSWDYNKERPWEFSVLLLRDWVTEVDPGTGLPVGIVENYRILSLTAEGNVSVRFLDKNGQTISEHILQIRRIPFVIFEITNSLLCDVANYQIALLNLASSDLAYLLKANYPFYTEQRDDRAGSSHLKRQGGTEEGSTDDEVRAGVMHGRTYPMRAERPGFIAPPTDPVKVSMEKQNVMRDEIRLLVNLSLSNVKPKQASAESKGMDEHGLEAGLSYIGLELEHGERQIAAIWAMYEGVNDQPLVRYPERYSLKTDEEVLDEVKALEERMMAVPSDSYKREVAKQIVVKMLGTKLHADKISEIMGEIDAAKILTTDPEVLFSAVEHALIDNKGAAKALGIPPESVEQAQKDHAERAARIAAAQARANMANRGVKDLAEGDDTKAEKTLSQDASTNLEGGQAVRK